MYRLWRLFLHTDVFLNKLHDCVTIIDITNFGTILDYSSNKFTFFLINTFLKRFKHINFMYI